MENSAAREIVVDIFNAAVRSVDPSRLVKGYSEYISTIYETEHCKRLYLASFGKAAFPMAKALSETMPDIITEGIVITKYRHAKGRIAADAIRVFEAGHPVPDENGYAATKQLIEMLKKSDDRALVLCLISGGGSALLTAPYGDVALGEKQLITGLLLNAGADIKELNTVRKHISVIKGGRLAEIAYPSKVLSLILSDVIGDPLDVIASGPTAPDETTYGDAIAVIEKYGLADKIPIHILNMLKEGAEGIKPDTPKAGSPVFGRVENIIIGSNRIATQAAAKKAAGYGLDTTVLTSKLQGAAREAAKWLAMETRRKREEGRKICLISGGETTVIVKGTGLGGRNTEFALEFAAEIEGESGVTLLSAGTDGTDGPTDAAGAVVDGQTIGHAKEKGFDPFLYLENNDSYTFFKNTGELFVTGSTGTNVMDIQIVLIE